jgi:hypothetical protein
MRSVLVSTLLVCHLCAVPALADPPQAAYVSTGSAGQILRVAGSTSSVLHTAPGSIGDLTLGPDLLLYASLPSTNMIVRLDPATPASGGVNPSVTIVYAAGTTADPLGPGELRFSAAGDLYFNAAGGGVWRVPASALRSTQPSATPPQRAGSSIAGSALAFTHAGDLIAGSGLSLAGIPVASGSYTFNVSVAATSVAVASGGEGSVLPLATGDVVVGAGVQLRLYSKQGAWKGVLATFPAGHRVGHVEIDADDRVFATTFVSDASTNAANGMLWEIQANEAVCGASGCRLVAATPRQNGKFAPMVGVALEPTGRRLEKVLTGTGTPRTYQFDFGSHFVEITGTLAAGSAAGCVTGVSSVPLGTAAAAALLATAPTPFSANPYLGEEGFATSYDIASTCRFEGGTIDFFVAALGSVNTNPRILRCHAADAAGCEPVPLLGFYATGPIDGDGGYGSRTTDNFSRWLIANEGLAFAGAQPTFCGLERPFGSELSNFSVGSNVSVKFRVAAPGGTCAAGPYLSTAMPLISVARVSPSFEAVRLPASSGNANDPPTFRYDPRSQQYVYNLSLTGYELELHELTITDLASQFASPPPNRFTVSASGGKK